MINDNTTGSGLPRNCLNCGRPDHGTIACYSTPIEQLIDMTNKLFVTNDSGQRETHSSGAVRDDATGKGSYELMSPLAMKRLAQLYERGAKKYAARNWEKGMKISRYVQSGVRHAFDYMEGKRDEDHPAAVMWNFAAIIHTEEMIKRGLMPTEYADMPNYMSVDQRIDYNGAKI